MQTRFTRRAAALLVPLALAGTCLAAAPLVSYADEAAAAAEGAVEAADVAGAGTAAESDPVASAPDAAAGQGIADGSGAVRVAGQGLVASDEGTLAFAGVVLDAGQDMGVRVAGSLVTATNPDDTYTIAVWDLSAASLEEAGTGADGGAADGAASDAGAQDARQAEAERLHDAFAAAAAASARDYSTRDVRDLGTRDLGEGVTAYLFTMQVSGPYEVSAGENGTTVTSPVGPDGRWTVTQAYIPHDDGGFALVQVAYSEEASDDDVLAAQGAVESIALAPQAEGDGAAQLAADGAGASEASGFGFAFDAPAGLQERGGMWVGTADDVMVEPLGTLVTAADAQGLTDGDVQATFEAIADRMGATLEGTRTVEAADAQGQPLEVSCAVYSLTQNGVPYEAMVALVPVADGSVEGLYAIVDEGVAASWTDRLLSLFESIRVLPAEDGAGTPSQA